MSGTATGASPVSATVVIAQHVRRERKDESLRWQAEINALCRTFPGFEAMEVVPPVPGIQDDYVVVFRFDAFPHLDAWLRSDSRKALLARGESLFAGDARQHVVAGSRPATRGAGIVVSTRSSSPAVRTSIANGRAGSTPRPRDFRASWATRR